MTLVRCFLAVVLSVSAFVACGRADVVQTRASWITASPNVPSPRQVTGQTQRMARVGMNTVYVQVWREGWPLFASERMREAAGIDRAPELRSVSVPGREDFRPEWDFLESSLIEAQRAGLIYVARFDQMLALEAGHPLIVAKPEWVTRAGGRVQLNPVNSEVRKIIVDTVLEVIDKWDIDGIQFDSGLGWLSPEMGADDYTRGEFAREHRGRQPSADPRDPEFAGWKARKADELVRTLVQDARQRKQRLLISYRAEILEENADFGWTKWAAWTPIDAPRLDGTTPRIDEFCLDLSTVDFNEALSAWRRATGALQATGTGRVFDLRAWICLRGEMGWEDLSKRIALIESTKAGGYAVGPASETMDRFGDAFAAIYNPPAFGIAAHPHFGTGWRSPSVKTSRGGTITTSGEPVWVGGAGGGRWRTIAAEGEGLPWRYLDGTTFSPGGRVEVRAPVSASVVELVRDRREEINAPKPRRR